MKIRQTRNYSEFVHDATNRPITEKDKTALKLLRESMKEYGFLPFPILCKRVGDRLRIIDGQHRFAIAQELNLPVLWVETDRDDIVIAKTAAGQRPWLMHDYVGSWAVQGKEAYQKLQEFTAEAGLPLKVSASLLNGEASHSGNVNDRIKSGDFRVRDMEYARRVARIIDVVRRYVPWATHSLSIAAVSRFCRVADFDDAQMIKRIETHPHLLKRCPTLDMFSQMYEDVYNHMSRQRIPLAFMAREQMAKRQDVGAVRKEKCRTKSAA